MMKKIIAICLVLMMLMTASLAFAESTWSAGLSPQKPYSGSPEADFNKSIGYMMLLPLTETNTTPGAITLQIFMPRADVQLGEGSVSIHSKKDGLVEEVMTDSGKITCREMTAEEMEALIWGSGCVFEVAFDAMLEANQEYYVHMTKGCIVSEVYGTSSPAIKDRTTWKFTTNANNYVESVSYGRKVEGKSKPAVVKETEVQPGDFAQLSIVLGDEAATAAIYCDNGHILPEATYFDASAETTISFPSAGEITWGIVFLDAEGNTLYSMEYTTVVAAAE